MQIRGEVIEIIMGLVGCVGRVGRVCISLDFHKSCQFPNSPLLGLIMLIRAKYSVLHVFLIILLGDCVLVYSSGFSPAERYIF